MTPKGAPTSARRETPPGASSAKATDQSAPIELATHVDGRELERVQDVPKEGAPVVEQIDASVVEWVGQPVARAVDNEHAAVPGERR